MPTIDKRFLVKLLLTVAVLLGALFGVHTWQARRIPDALHRQAERAIAAGKPDAAVRHLRQFLEFIPDDVGALEQLAELLRPRNAQAELIFLYDRILRTDPSRDSTRREALAMALRSGRYSDAVGHAEALLKAGPDALLLQQLAAAQAGLREFDAAKASYTAAVKLTPTDSLAWQRLAQFLMVDLRKPEEARKAVDGMVAALPNDPSSYLTRVRLTLMLDAEKPLPPRKSDPLLADVAHGLDLAPDHPDLLLVQAERLQRHRDIVGARNALAGGVAKHPGEQRLVRALAWLEVNRNNMAGAIGILEDALPHSKDPLDLLVPLADLVLDAGDVTKAEEILKKLDRRTGPTVKMQAKYLRGRLLMKASNWTEAIPLLTALRNESLSLPGLEAQANLLLSTCYQKTGEPAKAIDVLKLITAKDATNVTALVGLGQLYLNDGRSADAVKVYEIAAQSPFAPNTTITTLIRIQALQLAHLQAKPEAWTALEKQVQEFAPRYGSNSPEPAMLKAELATLAGNLPKAMSILKAESQRRPQSTALWCKLSEAVSHVEGVAAGLGVLDEAQGFVPDGAELRLARAKLYAADPAKLRPLDLLLNGTDNWSDAEQLQFALGMIEIYDSIGTPSRECWQRVLTRRPNDVETRLAYERAFATEPKAVASNDPNRFETVAAKLAKLAEQGDDAGLKKVLTRLATDPRWAGEPMRRAIQKANSPRLLTAARPFIERTPGGLGWLADHCQRFDPATANELRQLAVKSTQATVEDWYRAVAISETKGLAELQAARKALNDANYAALLVARSHSPSFSGLKVNVNKSRTAFDRVRTQAELALLQAQFDRKQAIATLESYLDSDELAAADRAWATRNLAMLLVVRGEVADRERAAKLLTDTTLNDAGATREDRRSTAGVLASLQRYLDGATRDAAMKRSIALMEGVSKESNSPKDIFSLCRLYKAAGRTDDAVAQLRGLLANDPGNIDYLLAGLDVLVEAKQYDTAKGFADRCLSLAGEEYRVVAAVARYEALRGEPAKALELAEGYFRTADPLAGDVPAKTARTAELLDELSRLQSAGKFTDAAVAKYESLLPGRGECLIKLCSLLATAGRADEAMVKIEKLGRGLPPRIVATAAITTLRIAGGTTHLAKVKHYLDAAKAEEPTAVPVQLCDAEYLTLRGDYAAAERIYEAILKDHPRNVAALNNLAWLLAAKPESATQALELIERAAKETGLTGELLDTRARIRLAAKQPSLAIADAGEALKHEKTALRYFHLGMAMNEMKPEDGAAYFKEAKQRGLTDRQIHPADVMLFQESMK